MTTSQLSASGVCTTRELRKPDRSRPVGLSSLLAFVAFTGLLAPGCALPAWAHGAPRFPTSEGGPWELPLYEPLTRVGPHVVGTLCGAAAADQAPPCEEVVLFVDSGSSHSALTQATFEHLGVATTTSRFATIEDAGGVLHSWSGGLVPEARIGDRLRLHDVVASIRERTPILGADILAAHGWQVDLDRGTLWLGGAPWPAGPDVVVVPTGTWGAHAFVDLTVQGARVPVLLDTGALVTVVERDVLLGLGRPERRLQFPFALGSGPRGAKLDSAFDVELGLGGRSLGQRSVPALTTPGVMSTHGMLGFDILSGYTFQVTRAGLRLRPRTGSLVDTAAARIGRWRQLPNCPDLPGCVAAAPATPGDPAARIHVRIAATFPRSMRFLFGCTDGHGRPTNFPLWLEVSLRYPVAGSEVETVPLVGVETRQLWASRCTGLALLDINPVIETVRPLPADVASSLTMEGRNVHLR